MGLVLSFCNFKPLCDWLPLSCGVFVWILEQRLLRATTLAGGMARGNRVDNCGSWTGDCGIGVLAGIRLGLFCFICVCIYITLSSKTITWRKKDHHSTKERRKTSQYLDRWTPQTFYYGGTFQKTCGVIG